MNKYSIELDNSTGCIVVEVEAATLTTAINKAMRRIDQMKKNLDKKGYDYAHLCGLSLNLQESKKIS
jgi:hypothetical protein